MSPRRSIAFIAALMLGVLAITAAVSSQVVDRQLVLHTAPTFRAYLTLADPQGAIMADRQENAIEVLGFGWGVSNLVPRPGTQTVAGVRPEVGDLVITKPIDRSSPLLALACAEGRTIADAELVFFARASDEEPTGIVRLRGVRIRSVEGETGSSAPGLTETVALAFGQVEWVYYARDERGGVNRIVAGWDVAENRGY
jgi:type VI secretion system secreted protein Hcp